MGKDFDIGDRVIITNFDSQYYSCDLTGYYGHVTNIYGGMIFVEFNGCLDIAPEADMQQFTIISSQKKPWPLYAEELEHAD